MKKTSKEVKIGIAFIIAMFILYYGISFLKGVNFFKPTNSYMVVYSDVSGLIKSAPVTFNGFQIGLVNSMEMDPNNAGRVLVNLSLDKGVQIPTGSKFYLEVSMLGSSSIIIERNADMRTFYTAEDTIVGLHRKSLLDAAGGMLPQVEQLLPKIDSILIGLQLLANNPALGKSLANVSEITGDLTKTTKQLNSMVGTLNKDIPQITGNLNAVSNDFASVSKKINAMDIESTYRSVDSTMKNIQQLSTKINTKDNTIGLMLNDRQMYDSLNSTINNAGLLLKDIKENPKRYINVKVF